MLLSIQIQNFVTIAELSLEFEQGLTTLTGEAGAGKSIIIDALSLILGERAEIGVIRAGAETTDIQAVFDLTESPLAQAWLTEQQLLEIEETECVIRRTLNTQGRSKAYINGRMATLAQLKSFGEFMVEIHGQHQHQKLLHTDHQREYLDDFAEHQPLQSQVKSAYQTWLQLDRQFQTLQNSLQERQNRLDYLRFQTEELSALALQIGETAELEKEQKRLSHLQRLQEDGYYCAAALSETEGGNVLSLLQQSLSRLDKMRALDEQCQSAYDLVSQALVNAEEAASELNHYLSAIEGDPETAQQVEQRLSTIYELARKHNVEPDALPALHQHLATERQQLEQADETVEELAAQRQTAWQNYLTPLAQQLSTSRQQAAQILSQKVSQQIQHLNLSGAEFEISLIPRNEPAYDADGLENIEFLICANPGQPFSPLSKTASGGELSRLSLAIEVVTAHANPTPTMIFDEVDVGIGGATAEVVGKLLRQLGERVQVLCVTHLPQVAAQGHHHFKVTKEQTAGTTHTKINRLDKYERICEVARMLAGVEITEQSMKNAQALLEKVA